MLSRSSACSANDEQLHTTKCGYDGPVPRLKCGMGIRPDVDGSGHLCNDMLKLQPNTVQYLKYNKKGE